MKYVLLCGGCDGFLAFFSLSICLVFTCVQKKEQKNMILLKNTTEKEISMKGEGKKMRNVILFVNKFDQFFSVGYIIVVDMDSYFSVHHHRSIERRSSIRFQQCGTLQLNLSTNCISI